MTSTQQSHGTDRTERMFKVAITIKGIDGGLQFLGALLLMVIPPTLITGIANAIITRDLLGDPNGTLSTHLATAADHFANGSSRWFAIIYLLAHGVIKLALVWALIKRVMVAFPIAVVVLAAFVVYELWRAVHTHSIALPIFAAIDVVIIVLVIREYRKLRRERAAA
ncbi:MAG TPA: DUF2127 domain-containing protein [Pseudonocardiaceae bacterium]|jgi:uncharacterized membrane protein|nr:DUF2127 domain-containing protein [Pseudonocardiaceae bacterium]